MENIEQLKLDNEKLTERLNNAAKFFREQKTQIEALTKENEELKLKASNDESQANWKAKYFELKEEIEKTPQEEIISVEKWNKLATDKEELEKKYDECELAFKAAKERIKMLEEYKQNIENTTSEEIKKLTATNNECITKYKILENDHNNSIINYENKITLLEEDNIKLSKDCHLYEEQINKYETSQKEKDTKYNNLNEAYEKLRTDYTKLKDEAGKEKQQLEIQINNHLERISQLENNIKTIQNSKHDYDELVKFKEEICKLVNMSEFHNTKKTENAGSHRMGSQYETKGFSI